MNLSTTNYILTLLFTFLISNNNVVVSFAPHHHQLSSYTNTFQQKVKPTSSHRRHQRFMASSESRKNEDETPHVENILLVECGMFLLDLIILICNTKLSTYIIILIILLSFLIQF